MKILIISPFLPLPTYNGGRTRLVNFIQILSTRHEITLAGLLKPNEYLDDAWYKSNGIEIFAYPRHTPFSCSNYIHSVFSGSLYVSTYFSKALKETLSTLLKKRFFDMAHVVCSYTVPNLPENIGIPVIVEEPNVQSLVLKQTSNIVRSQMLKMLYAIESNRLARIESRGVQF